MFAPKTRVVRAGYVVDLNVWGGVCVFWQVTLVDRGGGQLAGYCGPLLKWRWERESAVRRGTELASPAWSLGHTLYLFGKSGRLEVGAGVDGFLCLPMPATHGIATFASLSQSEAILGKLLIHWLTSHCRSHPISSHLNAVGYYSSYPERKRKKPLRALTNAPGPKIGQQHGDDDDECVQRDGYSSQGFKLRICYDISVL